MRGQTENGYKVQLATLWEAGLVADRREGTLIYYRLADEHLARLLEEGKALVLDLEGGNTGFPTHPGRNVGKLSLPALPGMIVSISLLYI